MSMTLVNAKIYVARIIGGGANSQESLDMAAEAILRGYQDWATVIKRGGFWRFLLRDTSLTTSVSGCNCTSGSAAVSAPTTAAFDFVNVGQTVTVTGAGDTVTLAASTTVSTVTRGSDGVVTGITLSANFGGTNDSSTTLTFSANIPVIAGSNDYSLPADWMAAYSARLITNPRSLVWRDIRYWDRVIVDPTQRGTPSEYNTYNPYSDLTQNFGTTHFRFDRVPDVNDTLFLRYYRKFNTTGTNIDIPDDMLYQFLDYCRNVLLATKRAKDDPAGYAKTVTDAAEGAQESDEEPTDDNDSDTVLKSQWEMGDWNRPLWGNGAFDPFRY